MITRIRPFQPGLLHLFYIIRLHLCYKILRGFSVFTDGPEGGLAEWGVRSESVQFQPAVGNLQPPEPELEEQPDVLQPEQEDEPEPEPVEVPLRPGQNPRAFLSEIRHFTPIDMGRMDIKYQHCRALHWLCKRKAGSSKTNPLFSKCCLDGNIQIPCIDLQRTQEYMRQCQEDKIPPKRLTTEERAMNQRGPLIIGHNGIIRKQQTLSGTELTWKQLRQESPPVFPIASRTRAAVKILAETAKSVGDGFSKSVRLKNKSAPQSIQHMHGAGQSASASLPSSQSSRQSPAVVPSSPLTQTGPSQGIHQSPGGAQSSSVECSKLSSLDHQHQQRNTPPSRGPDFQT
jgi:hypothetical protein